MVPVIARYAENPPKLPHMAADITSKTNERVFQYPYRRAIENDGSPVWVLEDAFIGLACDVRGHVG